ncbi:MAG: nuclear transport factor 2 family protein [Halobacteriota archaeon]
MKLFKDSPSRRIYKYVDDFQRSVQNGNYRAARDAVEKALKVDPLNERLLEMKHTILELVQTQESRERPALSDVTPMFTQGEGPSVLPLANESEGVEATLRSYGAALIAEDADAAASMWDESSADLTYISADYGAIRKGYREIRDALRSAASNYSYMTYALIGHSADDANLAYAFYEVRVARLWDAYANIPGCKRVTLVLRKKGGTWKIVHGHESSFTC